MNSRMQGNLQVIECRNIFVRYIVDDKDIKEMVIQWLRNPEMYADELTRPKLNEQQLDYLADKLSDCNPTTFLRHLANNVSGETLTWIHTFMVGIKNSFKECNCC